MVILLSIDSLSVDSVLESQTSVTGRSLLHAKKKCEVNFEYMNYMAMTKRCKSLAFPAKECCSAFKEFACPYANQINDMNNDCAKTMCKEMKDGLFCPPRPLSSPSLINTSTAVLTAPEFIMLLISAMTAVLTFLVL
ncbi:hypothetical protein EUTSA_v10011146mg [Eutrema salsugineum]|uniref:GPI-anchored protein LLG1-like domain-containing protein n=1 Tax=Eutrema salsugineum TaxID=72664 RepID=V4NHU4_EUTSA|nr:hypothetical protein EUTSA_v10011146mg [Eutrema salsugineum]